ncbi:MAG: hypothetical protein LBC59_09500 [Chitinispirillales bacterium]|jgi:DNA-binding LytR/AlgR family response regulator|nr:hypothetical protein [Chitinispirillales bacterium]
MQNSGDSNTKGDSDTQDDVNTKGDIDEVLDEALDSDFRSVFEPNMEDLCRAVFLLVKMRFKMKALDLLAKEEDLDLNTAFGVIAGHLEAAYPGFKKALMG